jgi:hypothetical protein
MKKLLASLALAAGLGFAATPASAAVVVTFTSADTQYDVGETVVVEARISGLGDEILSAFDTDLVFGAGVLDATSVTYYAVLELGGLANSYFGADFSGGRVGTIVGSLLDDATLAATQADEFLLLTYAFTAIADGVTTLTLGADLDFERNFVGLDALSLDVEVGSLCIAVGTGHAGAVGAGPAGAGVAAPAPPAVRCLSAPGGRSACRRPGLAG